MPRIERIETAGPDSRARRLVFSDGEPRLTAGTVVRVLGLLAGETFDDDSFGALLAESEREQAKERGFRLLGYRDRSFHELRRRLRDDGYPTQVAEAVVARFIELGLLDDERFAAAYVRNRVYSGFGPRRIARELSERGIPPELAEEALRAGLGEGDAAMAQRALRGRTASDRKERDRLTRRLVARGFSYSAATQAIDAESSDQAADGE